MARYQRRIKLIRPRLQLKLVATFAAIALLALLLQFLLFSSALSAVASELPNDGPRLLSSINGILASTLAISLCVFLPLCLHIGVLVTHRIAGPIHRFETFLEQVTRGEQPEDIRLRKGDELLELCAWINRATQPLRAGASAGTAGASTQAAQAPQAAQASQASSNSQAA